MPSILDFNDNGGAIIEIPQIDSDYSLVLNHWKSADIELQKIEQDILQPDSPQRTSFLEKCAKEIQQFFDFEDIISFSFDQYLNNLFEEEEYESEEERQFYEEEQNKSIEYTHSEGRDKHLHIYNFELKHSLAWYLMNQVDNEIEKIEQQIYMQKGIIKSCESINETITILRKAKSEYQAITELIKHFPLSKLQAKAVVKMTLRELTGKSQDEREEKIKILEFLKSFLEELKE